MTTLAMKHPGELTLRRFLADETLDASTTAHLGECAECATRLAKLREEQKAFEAEVPFERFAAGVEKAARVQQRRAPGPTSVVLVALAACFVAFFAGKQIIEEGSGGNRLKGGASVDFVIAGPAGQRPATELEQLAPGERVRIGVSGHRHVLALSIDDAGEVSTVYSESLASDGQTWLPGSFEFTGKGREHLVVLLTDEPLGPDAVASRLRERFKAAAGDVTKLGSLEVGGVQVHRTFLKP